jgi:excisionase family DNA binding protein
MATGGPSRELSADEAAELLGVNPRHVRRLAAAHQLRAEGVGAALRVLESALIEYASSATVPTDEAALSRKWYSVAEVAEMLGYGLTKTKSLVLGGEIRSLKDGRSRRILPEWVDEYVTRRAASAGDAA